MKTTVFIFFLGVSATYAGVLSGIGSESLDLHGHGGVIHAHIGEYLEGGIDSSAIPLEADLGIDAGHGLGGAGAFGVGIAAVDLGSVVQQHVHVTRRVGIPVPQPVPVHVARQIPVSVPHAVDVPVERPYPVHVPVPVAVKVYRDVPVPHERPVPVPVKVHVKVPVKVPYKVYHAHPVPVKVIKKFPVPVPRPVIVKKHVPIAVHHTHLEPLHGDIHHGWD